MDGLSSGGHVVFLISALDRQVDRVCPAFGHARGPALAKSWRAVGTGTECIIFIIFFLRLGRFCGLSTVSLGDCVAIWVRSSSSPMNGPKVQAGTTKSRSHDAFSEAK